MPLDKSFNLDAPEGITKDDINEMEEENRQIKELAISAEENVEKILQAKKKLDSSGMDFATKNIMSGGVAVSGQGTPQIGTSQEDLIENIRDILVQIEKQKKELAETKNKLTDEEKRLIVLEKAQQKMNEEIKKGVGDVEKGMDDFENIATNPTGFAKRQIMGKIGKAGMVGMLILFLYKIAEKIYQEIVDSFKDGGKNDIRKLMDDRDKEMAELNDVLDRRNGRVFFSSDVDLHSGAPQLSNTTSMRDQVLRYQALNLD